MKARGWENFTKKCLTAGKTALNKKGEQMPKDKQNIQAYLPTRYAEAIKKEAECDSRSVSDFVRLLLIDYVNQNFLLEKFGLTSEQVSM